MSVNTRLPGARIFGFEYQTGQWQSVRDLMIALETSRMMLNARADFATKLAIKRRRE
jgi:hypothetical protein